MYIYTKKIRTRRGPLKINGELRKGACFTYQKEPFETLNLFPVV